MSEIYMPKREDRDLLFIMHLSQLLSLVSGVGGLIAPLIIWAVKKDEIIDLDRQGRDIINFQLTMLIAAIVSAIFMPIVCRDSFFSCYNDYQCCYSYHTSY